jgi:branched-chain amino acid transport system substrate-binding protein
MSPGANAVAATSPAIVASVGSLSGPVGSVMAPVVEGVQVWVKSINARGGLSGHLVKLLVYDDSTDPARHRSQVQEAIEVKKVIAFVGNPEGFTGGASQDYITSKRVPVIGSETGSDHFYKSPMYFPQAPHGSANFRVAIRAAAQQTVPLGKVKLATITCAEVQQCEDADRVWAEDAPSLGFRHAYRGRAALTQPDFTAECLAARNAAAEVFLLGLDGASIGRVAASCARQGYRPIFGTFSGLILDRM